MYYYELVYPPNHFGGWVAGSPARTALAFYWSLRMFVNIYVDAFNLYYGSMLATPFYKFSAIIAKEDLMNLG